MNQPQQEPDYPWADVLPALGHTIEVAPGVRWLRMPLPFALNHVNLWLLRDQIDSPDGPVQGWTVVDGGVADDPTRAAWEQVFDTQLDGLPVLRVVATHMHPDHVGLAHWLTQRWSRTASATDAGFECRLWMSATDFAAARLGSRADPLMGGQAAAAFVAAHGLVDATALAQIRARAGFYASMVPQVPATYRRLMDGGVLTIGSAQAGACHAWHCIAGYGHAPEHIALHSPALGVLVAGECCSRASRPMSASTTWSPKPTRWRCSWPRWNACAHCPPTRWCCPRTASRFAGCTPASIGCSNTMPIAWPT